MDTSVQCLQESSLPVIDVKWYTTCKTCADDAKAVRKVNNGGDKQHLQNYLDKLVKCSETLQILFSFGKCKCLHT